MFIIPFILIVLSVWIFLNSIRRENIKLEQHQEAMTMLDDTLPTLINRFEEDGFIQESMRISFSGTAFIIEQWGTLPDLEWGTHAIDKVDWKKEGF